MDSWSGMLRIDQQLRGTRSGDTQEHGDDLWGSVGDHADDVP